MRVELILEAIDRASRQIRAVSDANKALNATGKQSAIIEKALQPTLVKTAEHYGKLNTTLNATGASFATQTKAITAAQTAQASIAPVVRRAIDDQAGLAKAIESTATAAAASAAAKPKQNFGGRVQPAFYHAPVTSPHAPLPIAPAVIAPPAAPPQPKRTFGGRIQPAFYNPLTPPVPTPPAMPPSAPPTSPTTFKDYRAKASANASEAQANLVGAVATSAAISAPIFKAFGAYNKFEDTLNEVGFKADLTGAKIAHIGEIARNTARQFNMTSVEYLTAMDELGAGGLALEKSAQVMPAVAKAALATKSDFKELAVTTITLIDNLKVLPEEAQKAFDIMDQAGKEGRFELKDMARYFPTLGAAYAAQGQTGLKAVADISAAAQVVRKNVGTAGQAGTDLQQLLDKSLSPVVQKHFMEQGFDLVQFQADQGKLGKSPIETLINATKQASGGDMSKLTWLFRNTEQLTAIRALIQHEQMFYDLRQKIINQSAGVIEQDFLTRMGLGVEKTKALTNSLYELSVTMGGVMGPALNRRAEELTKLIFQLNEWVKANPELAATIGQAALATGGFLVASAALRFVLATLKVGLLALFTPLRWLLALATLLLSPFRFLAGIGIGLFSGLFGGIGAAIASVGGWGAAFGILMTRIGGLLKFLLSPLLLLGRAFMALGAAMLATPIGWIIAGIVALAGAAYLIYQNWDKIGPYLAGVWDTITSAASNGMSSLWSWFTGLGPRLMSALGTAFAGIGSWFAGLGSRLVARLGDAWSAVRAWFADLSWPDLPSFTAVIGDVFDPVVLALKNSWKAIVDWFASIEWPKFPDIPDPIAAIAAVLDPVLTFFSKWGGELIDSINKTFDTIGTFAGNIGKKVGDFLSPITDGFKAISSSIFGPSASDVKATTDQANAAKAAIDAIAPAATAAVASATAVFNGVSFFAQGVAMMTTLAAGIRSGSAAAVAAARETVQVIRDHLPHSPAKVGPLSDLDRVQFGQTLAGAITGGSPQAIAAARVMAAGLAASIPVALPSPSFAAPGMAGLSGPSLPTFAQPALAAPAVANLTQDGTRPVPTAGGLSETIAAARVMAAGFAAALPSGLPSPAFATAGLVSPSPPTFAQPSFANPTQDGMRSDQGVGGTGPISVSLTLSPNFSGATAADFVEQLKAALPQAGYELGEAIKHELDRRDRTKH